VALKVQFSAGDLGDEITGRATQGRESVVAKRDLGRYYNVLRRSLPTFTIGEARVIVRAVDEGAKRPGRSGRDDDDGYGVDPALLWAYVARMKDVVDDERARAAEPSPITTRLTPEGRARMQPFPRTEVDVDTLVARLRALTFAEAVAVVDAVERVASEYTDEDGGFEFDPPYMDFSVTELTSVGLVATGDQAFDVIAYRYEPVDLGLDRLLARLPAPELVERIEEIAAGPFRVEKDARAAATKMRAAEGDGPRRFVVRDTRDRDMLRTAQPDEDAAVV